MKKGLLAFTKKEMKKVRDTARPEKQKNTFFREHFSQGNRIICMSHVPVPLSCIHTYVLYCVSPMVVVLVGRLVTPFTEMNKRMNGEIKKKGATSSQHKHGPIPSETNAIWTNTRYQQQQQHATTTTATTTTAHIC